jgi:ATP-dependent 26S proteasome regulatory subunit
MSKDDLSCAGIKTICSKAGLLALHERYMFAAAEDFAKSKENVLRHKGRARPRVFLPWRFLIVG